MGAIYGENVGISSLRRAAFPTTQDFGSKNCDSIKSQAELHATTKLFYWGGRLELRPVVQVLFSLPRHHHRTLQCEEALEAHFDDEGTYCRPGCEWTAPVKVPRKGRILLASEEWVSGGSQPLPRGLVEVVQRPTVVHKPTRVGTVKATG